MAEVTHFAAIGARDQSVLLAIAQWELLDNSPGRFLELPELQRRLEVQLPEQALTASVGRLVRADYVEAAELSGAGIEEYTIKRLTLLGLQECGAYPRPQEVADRLVHFLEAQAAEAERTDPERGRKIRRAAQTLVDIGTTFSAKFAAEMAKPG
jgi:hypothetical protein